MTVKISQENGKAVVSVDGNEALKADAGGNVEVVGDLEVGTVTSPDSSNELVFTNRSSPDAFVFNGEGTVTSSTQTVFKIDYAGSNANAFEINNSGDTHFAVSADGRTSITTNAAGLRGLTIFNNSLSNDNLAAVSLRTPGGQGSVGLTRKAELVLESKSNIYLESDAGKVKLGANSSTIPSSAIPAGGVALPDVYVDGDLEVNGTTIAALIARIEALEAGN